MKIKCLLGTQFCNYITNKDPNAVDIFKTKKTTTQIQVPFPSPFIFIYKVFCLSCIPKSHYFSFVPQGRPLLILL